jgi:hypothetical protein
MMETNQGAAGIANEHTELLNLALKAAIECLDGISAMNISLAQTVADTAAQISGSLMLIRRITEMANSPPPLPVPLAPHSVEWQAILTATDGDFATTVDFNAWKEKHHIADLADSFRLSARSAEDISPATPASSGASLSDAAQEIAIAELVMQQEGGH